MVTRAAGAAGRLRGGPGARRGFGPGMLLRLPLAAVAASLFLVASAGAEPAPPAVRVSEAPLGKFGFYTGYGGPIWSFTIKRLVVQATKPGGPADQAGLRKGDEILAIDGLSVPGRARSEVFGALRSKDARSIVIFRVAPEEGGPAREVRVRVAEKL